MTYIIKVTYRIDSDIPGDSCLRSEKLVIEADNEDDAFEFVDTKYNFNGDIVSKELINDDPPIRTYILEEKPKRKRPNTIHEDLKESGEYLLDPEFYSDPY